MGHSRDTSAEHQRPAGNNREQSTDRQVSEAVAVWLFWGVLCCFWVYCIILIYNDLNSSNRMVMRVERGRWPPPVTITCGRSFAAHRWFRKIPRGLPGGDDRGRSRWRRRSPPPAPNKTRHLMDANDHNLPPHFIIMALDGPLELLVPSLRIIPSRFAV